MLELTEEQVAFIENDIMVRGITSPDLSIDLLDHICCLIETKLDEYTNFEAAYHETLLLFGEKGLKEIQLETNRLLTFKHYYIMNNTMKISGYISSLMILVGSFFKINHWLGANVLVLSGVFFFTTLFLPLIFILKFKSSDESNRNITLSVIGFVSALLISLGILFRILHWPNGRLMILAGCALMVLGYLPIYLLSIYKNTTNKINASATVIMIIAGVGLFLTESNVGQSREVSDSFWRGVIETNELFEYLKKENDSAFKNLQFSDSLNTSNASLLKLKSETDNLVNYITKMKSFLISHVEDIPLDKAATLPLDNLRISGGGDIQTVLFAQKGEYSARTLKSKIEHYKSFVTSIDKNADVLILNTSTYTVYDEKVEWSLANFEGLPLPLVVFNLTRMQLAAESIEAVLLAKR